LSGVWTSEVPDDSNVGVSQDAKSTRVQIAAYTATQPVGFFNLVLSIHFLSQVLEICGFTERIAHFDFRTCGNRISCQSGACRFPRRFCFLHFRFVLTNEHRCTDT
jgi:hypothetical protein